MNEKPTTHTTVRTRPATNELAARGGATNLPANERKVPSPRARPTDSSSDRPPNRPERILGAALPVILAVGVFFVAFVHVHDVARWAGQPDWASWLIAVSVELMALASIVEIRYRHRTDTGIGWPVVTLIAGIGMSGAANLAASGPNALTSEPGPWTPTMALWPVVAFGLVAGLKATRPTHARLSGGAPSTPDIEVPPDKSGPSSAAKGKTDLPADLLATGQEVAAELARQGQPVTRTALARGVRERGHRCSTARATLLLAVVRENTT